MGVFEHFPYTNFHDLNLDWIVQELEKLTSDVRDFISINAIKYANPIQWDITSQYEKNTVVLDKNGNAYLSVQPVPAGVSLDRTEYWTNIGNFSALWESVREAITIPDEGHETTASAPRAINDLVWVNSQLLEVTSPMIAGDRYAVGSNCRVYSVQIFLEETLAALQQEQQAREQADSAMADSIEKIKDQVYNVRFMGAKGDGITDDTAIFKQLESVAGIVYIPNGIYYLSDTISLQNCTMCGESKNAVIENHGKSELFSVKNCRFCNISFKDKSNFDGNISIVALMEGVCNVENCEFFVNYAKHIGISVFCEIAIVSDCSIDGNGVSTFGIHCDYANNKSSLTVENCVIKNFVLNGVFSSAISGLYTGCRFSGNHIQVAPNGGGQIDVLSNCVDNVHRIVSCFFTNPGGVQTNAVETYNTQAIIDNCMIDNTGASIAIAIQKSVKDVVQNCFIKYGNIGINVASDAACNILNNTFSGNGGSCVNVENDFSYGKVISGNSFQNGAAHIRYNVVNLPAYFTFGDNGKIFEGSTAEAIKITFNKEGFNTNQAVFAVNRGSSFGIYAVSRFGDVTTVFANDKIAVSFANHVITFTPTDSDSAYTAISRLA